jgi:poly-gamma-glutamate capsule biosynthesis protein CapA/YwtB (metallophosphatase superfamily)
MTRRTPGWTIAVVTAASWIMAAGLRADPWPWRPAASGDVEFLVIGDIQVQRRVDPTSAFAHVRDTLKKADLVYANLEGMLVPSKGPVGDIPDKKWVHPGPDGVKALVASNIGAVGVANNVVWDEANLLETMRVLDQHGVKHVGGGRNIDEAHRPLIIERKGVTFGFLQYTARWYRQAVQVATPTKAGVARILSFDGVTIDAGDLARLKADVAAVRGKADVVVVSHHNRDGATPVQFGDEQASERGGARADRTKAEEYQKLFARTALDAGADFVFGHGTHTIQGTEIYKGKPIVYAVGHSAFDQPGYEDSKDGLVVRVLVGPGKKIRRVSFVPVTRDATNTMIMTTPTSGEGARLYDIVKRSSPGVPLPLDGQEVVLLGPAPAPTSQRR